MQVLEQDYDVHLVRNITISVINEVSVTSMNEDFNTRFNTP